MIYALCFIMGLILGLYASIDFYMRGYWTRLSKFLDKRDEIIINRLKRENPKR